MRRQGRARGSAKERMRRVVKRQGRARGSAGERTRRVVRRQGRAHGSAGERASMKIPVLGFWVGVRVLVERASVSAMASGASPAGLGKTMVMMTRGRNGAAFRHGHVWFALSHLSYDTNYFIFILE
jgi:hypothetical protein